jgi:hypothetical protein
LFKLNSDLCKDPSNSGIFGCFVNDTSTLWEPCFFSRRYYFGLANSRVLQYVMQYGQYN